MRYNSAIIRRNVSRRGEASSCGAALAETHRTAMIAQHPEYPEYPEYPYARPVLPWYYGVLGLRAFIVG